MLKLIGANWTERAFGLGAGLFWLAVILALLAGVVTLARRYREHGSLLGSFGSRASGDEDDPTLLLTKFRDLHSRGTLGDDEYRTIKAKLATEIHANLDDTPRDGNS